jgi:hypothetical protein
VRDGQTSPHRPRLVVSRSTCPPLSPSENSFIIGTAVINTRVDFDAFGTEIDDDGIDDDQEEDYQDQD